MHLPQRVLFVNVPFPHGGQTWYGRHRGATPGSGCRMARATRAGICATTSAGRVLRYRRVQWYVALMQQVGAEKSLNDLVICKSNTRASPGPAVRHQRLPR